MKRLIFKEFEAYTESIQNTDVRLTLSSLHKPHWSISHLEIGSVHIQAAFEGGGSIAEGASSRDGWIFYMPGRGIQEVANGNPMSPDSVLVMPPGAEFYLAAPTQPINWFAVFVPTDYLFPTHLAKSNQKSSRIITIGKRTLDRFRTCVERITQAAAIEPTVYSEAACVAAFTETLLKVLRRIVGVADLPTDLTGSPARWRSIVQLAVGLIDECPALSPTVSVLAKRVGLSERTLRSAFHCYLGVSPNKYLALRRLNDARKRLLKCDANGVTVAAVAAEFGFWDFGRFAGKYRKLFGELPSETLRRK